MFEEYDDPEYWDEGDEDEPHDRREHLGVILSYQDLKSLEGVVPDTTLQKMIAHLDNWGDTVASVLD